MLTKISLTILLSFIISLIFGYFLINFLKTNNVNQELNRFLKDSHRSKKNTPTMGGLIFILATLFVIILLIFLNIIKLNYNLIIVLFTFISYGLIGFIDDYLIIKRHNNKGLSPSLKFNLQLIISVIFFYFFIKSGNEPLLWIHTLHFKLNIGVFYGLFILFVLVASSNAVNLTDGLDGLAGGLSLIAFLTFAIISYDTGWLDGYISISLFCFALVGSLCGFLVYNVNPAKVFMGDTGSLALGATLGSIAILTRHELLLIVIGIVFVLETLSCILQIIYFKLTKKRLFLMTPIHHTFEKLGLKETNIVRMFWIIGIIASLISLCFGVIL